MNINEPQNSIMELMHQDIERIRTEISKSVIGQQQVVNQVLIVLLASGHALLEGMPGMGKTLLIHALAKTFDGKFARIQFTPDLMPTDVTGHPMYDMSKGQFHIKRGPVFTNLLLADEINRAPAKTQSALLEVMQEYQVTIDAQPIKLDGPFMTLATQNPIEQEGTYPLPEAQLDRFLMKILMDYPDKDTEKAIVELVTKGKKGAVLSIEQVQVVVNAERVLAMQAYVANVKVDEHIMEYAVAINRKTRDWREISLGSGPRGAISMVRAAKAKAFIEGRDFVMPDDIKQIALPVLRHRIQLAPEVEIQGKKVDQVLMDLLASINAPRS